MATATQSGIMLNDFSPNGVAQLNLFDDVQPPPHSDALMKVLTALISIPDSGKSGLPDGYWCRTGR